MVFGSLEDAKIQKKENHVPIGIITEGSYAKRDIKKDTVLTRDDIELNEDNIIVKTRREQEKIY